MKAFIVHSVIKIVWFTDAPYICLFNIFIIYYIY